MENSQSFLCQQRQGGTGKAAYSICCKQQSSMKVRIVIALYIHFHISIENYVVYATLYNGACTTITVP